MDTRNWTILAVAIVLLLVIYFVFFQPRAEAPTETAEPPATTEQPAEPAPDE